MDKLGVATTVDGGSAFHNRAIAASLQLSRHRLTGTPPYWLLGASDNGTTLSVSQVLEVIAMDNKPDQDNSQASDQLHPFVYAALAGLAFWLVVSAWIFFSEGGSLGLDLGIASVLVFMIVAIPTVIHFVGRRYQAEDQASSIRRPFGAWISGDFDIGQGRRESASASIEILLPMAAAVIGITAMGVVFRLTEAGSSWL